MPEWLGSQGTGSQAAQEDKDQIGQAMSPALAFLVASCAARGAGHAGREHVRGPPGGASHPRQNPQMLSTREAKGRELLPTMGPRTGPQQDLLSHETGLRTGLRREERARRGSGHLWGPGTLEKRTLQWAAHRPAGECASGRPPPRRPGSLRGACVGSNTTAEVLSTSTREPGAQQGLHRVQAPPTSSPNSCRGYSPIAASAQGGGHQNLLEQTCRQQS